MRVLFQMSPNDSGALLDSPAASKLGRNRTLSPAKSKTVWTSSDCGCRPRRDWSGGQDARRRRGMRRARRRSGFGLRCSRSAETAAENFGTLSTRSLGAPAGKPQARSPAAATTYQVAAWSGLQGSATVRLNELSTSKFQRYLNWRFFEWS